jgi:hypothetical protein
VQPIIDGERWIQERLRFLRERLDTDGLDLAERTAIEDEIETLSKERGLTVGGHRSLALWRRWRRR